MIIGTIVESKGTYNPLSHDNEKYLELVNFLKLAANTFHDATKLLYVYANAILKLFMSKFQEIYYILGTFHCNVLIDCKFP